MEYTDKNRRVHKIKLLPKLNNSSSCDPKCLFYDKTTSCTRSEYKISKDYTNCIIGGIEYYYVKESLRKLLIKL